MSDTRARVLDAAVDELLERGWSRLRMSAIATRAGTSRQTVYTLYGTPDALARALVDRLTGEFLDGVEAAMDRAAGPAERWAAAVAYTLGRGAHDPVLTAMLARGDEADFLRMLTSDGGPVLGAARDRVAAVTVRHEPDLTVAAVASAAETAVRLALSHLLLPLHPPEVAARLVADAALGVLAARGLEVPAPG